MARKQQLKDGARVDRNIFARVALDGRVTAFQVKLTVPGTTASIAERFDSLEEARSYRDSLRADLALEPYKERVLRAREEARRRGAISGLLVGEVLRVYSEKVTPTRKGATSQRYMIDRLRRYPFAKLPVISLSTRPLEELACAIAATGVSRSTVGKHLALVSAVLKWARSEYGDPKLPNPVSDLEAGLRSTAGNERERRLLRGEEDYLRASLAQSANRELLHLFDLAIETGARQSELLNIKRQDIDLAGCVATARDTKNGSDRPLLLSAHAIDVLRELLSRPVRAIDGKLFAMKKSNLGQRWTEAKGRAARRYLADCAASGSPLDSRFFADLHWHDLRHEAISRVAELGWSEVQLMMFSGHREPRMLLRYVQYRQHSSLAKLLPARRHTR